MAAMLTYFDNNATTPLDPRVLEAMLPYLSGMAGNPSSLHRNGRRTRSAIDTAREQLAELVNAHPSQVIFTSGGSESNNMVLKGLVYSRAIEVLWLSAIEHDSVRHTVAAVESALQQVQTIPVDSHGVMNMEYLYQLDPQYNQLVSTQWVNNENGVIQNIQRINQIVKSQNALHHVDGVQALGKISLDFNAYDMDFLSLSSHKIFGPQGVGALIVKNPQKLIPLVCGGGQEKGLRSGTENVAGIVGFGLAAELARQELTVRQSKNLVLRNQLEAALTDMPGVVILSEAVPRVSNTCLFAVSGMNGEMLLMELDRQGFCVSSGSACQSRAGKPSHVLEAMSLPETLVDCVIRVSFNHLNQVVEVERFIAVLKELCSD